MQLQLLFVDSSWQTKDKICQLQPKQFELRTITIVLVKKVVVMVNTTFIFSIAINTIIDEMDLDLNMTFGIAYKDQHVQDT